MKSEGIRNDFQPFLSRKSKSIVVDFRSHQTTSYQQG
jgi:hypothetical protein